MIRAVDNKGHDVLIWSANKGEQYFCPICHQPLIQRRGEIREHHFAHRGSRGDASSVCTDRWTYDKTAWHIDWQRRFPEDCCEKIISSGGRKHIADVQINNLVIEFQHSSISLEEFRQRNNFYTNAGFRVVWVFDLIEEWEEDKIEEAYGANNKYTWSHTKKVFREMDIKNEDATVYFQFSDDEDKESGVLERVTGGYNGFSQFYTDLNNALSIPEFIEKAKEADSSLIPKKVAQQESPDSVPNGHSIFDLWKTSYAYMIVQNLCTQKTMIIFGNDGVMNHQGNGKIIGKYTWQKNGKNEYSPQKYVVWEAEKDIWSLRYSKAREITPPVSPRQNKETYSPVSSEINESEHYTGSPLISLINSTDSSVCFFYCQKTKIYYFLEFVNGRRAWNAYIFDPETGEIGSIHQNATVWAYAHLPCWEVYNCDE